jgi:two-component system, NtrC family, sensor kinase
LALTVTFGIVAGVTVNNQTVVEKHVSQVRRAYVPLALVSKDLARRAEDLKSYLHEAVVKEPSIHTVDVNLQYARERRDKALTAMQRTLADLAGTDVDPRIQREVDHLQASAEALAPLYERLRGLFARGEALDSDAVNAALAPIRDGERRWWNQATQLAAGLETNVRRHLNRLEDNEIKSRRITIYSGLTAVVLGLLITVWTVITLRPLRRLRDAARRVASGDYGSRIEEKGPAEVADLAREFNSMARAVDERERELVRSERLAAIGKMAAMITHEVRNPLSSIGLNTELLDDELGDASEEARKLCRAIHREVDRLTAITEEYLAFARLPKPKIAPEAVNPMVGALAAFVRGDLAARNVTLEVELGDPDPIALADAAQLRQCLLNLVRNATDAVAVKGAGTVTLRTRRMGDRIAIEVEDDGVGIAPEVLPRLFDPFFSTKEGGSGLGLALTQQIVKDHGGDLAVHSEPGRGTTFTVSLPAKPA